MAEAAASAAVHHEAPQGFIRKYIFSYDHKIIGIQYYLLALVSVFVGMGLSLFMTMLVMAPIWNNIKAEAIDPYLDNRLSQREAFDTSLSYMREFMLAQIEKTENEADIFLFLEHHRGVPIGPEEEILPDDVPTTVLIPAFILSELKTAFIMGFKIYLPFLVIDMVIASILISMGMMMLPPVLISLPFKLLLFVLADGWHLVAGTLIASFE